MEQSKLISGMILKLKVAYPYFFKDLEDEEFVALTKMYQEQIIGYTPEIVLKAIDEIIRTSKFMPSIAEILDKCDSSAKTYSYDILEKMKNDGYFKRGIYGELDDTHATRNYEKATMWLSKGIIPQWLLEDMMSYGYKTNTLLPDRNNEEKRIGSVNNVKLLEA